MKKIKFFALMSAIALTSAVGFTACSSSDEVTQDNNPTYDGTSVRTDFAFNVSKASKGTTRMTADIVQQTSSFDFRGMTDMYLLPFHGVPGTATTTNHANYPLGVLNNTADITESKSSKVYSLSIPVGTDNFLFYAKATRASGTNFVNGRVSSSFYDINGDRTTVTTSPLTEQKKAEDIASINDIQFSLTPIQTSLGTDATELAQYLTDIANTPNWAGTVTLAATDGRYSSLADLYTKFTTNYNARSGSVESIKRIILDLYRSAKAINAESTVSEVQTIANAIVAKTNPGTGVRIIVNDTDANPDNWTAASANVDETFPAGVLGLPMGAAQLMWDGAKFIYNDSPYYAANTIGIDHTALSSYSYPAELLYFDNSPLRATSTYMKASDYPYTTATWDVASSGATSSTGFDSDKWTDSEVKSATRAVAMKNNINYGVSLLKSTVELTTTTLKDNMTNILHSPTNIDQTITIGQQYTVGSDTKERQITLNGILVGGQPGTVNWQMLPASTAFDHVIYDKTLPADATHNWNLFVRDESDSNSSNHILPIPFYTAVFDNYTTESTQKDVLVALEFVNNTGMDFYGVNGLIPAGNTFYLVGKLQLTSGTGTLEDYPDGYRIPYATKASTDDASIKIVQRVFLQDHEAVAAFKLNASSLKNAYSTIPDLRSTEVLFGLSVDLVWKNGLSFEVGL